MRRLRRRYGHARKHSAAGYDFLRWMPGWTITGEQENVLIAHRMPAVHGEQPGPVVEFVRVKPRDWHARALGLSHRVGRGTTPRAAFEDAMHMPEPH